MKRGFFNNKDQKPNEIPQSTFLSLSLSRRGNNKFGLTIPCYRSHFKICTPHTKTQIWIGHKNKMLEREVYWPGTVSRRCRWWCLTPNCLWSHRSEVRRQSDSNAVTWKMIYSVQKSVLGARVLYDQYLIHKNKYGNIEQCWKSRHIAKVNLSTPFLSENISIQLSDMLYKLSTLHIAST